MKNSLLMASVVLLNLWAGAASAQVQVVESGLGQAPASASATGAGGGGNDLLLSLYNQLESLQQEVQTLRGMVEEQSYRLQRLETETRSRYLDIDSRLSAMAPLDPAAQASGEGAPPVPGAIVDTSTGDVRTSVGFNPALNSSPAGTQNTAPTGFTAGGAAAPAATPAPATPALDPALQQMPEQDLYRTALNLLLEEGKSAESATMFAVYAQRFPQGRLLPNALYWQGEALILLARYPEAQAAFERVLNEFSTDAKAAGAMLKLGVVQNLLGNRAEAERIWRELPLRFPESASEINLARDYLSRP